MTDAQFLLRQYVERGSESAFRELVTRYIDFVYSVALRRVGGNTHLAQDVAQTVFTDLARKARTLPSDVMLGGWLHRHTCFVSSTMIRHERRRQARERNAVEMNALHAPVDADWNRLVPILDEVVDQLGADDRQAIILRFFEGLDLRAVGAAFGGTDDAAQKRVSRALDKLRELLVQRGVTLAVTALATALASRAVTAAPVGLATTVSSVALLAGVSGAGLTAGILKLIAPLPVKLAVGIAVIAAVVTPIILHYRHAGDVGNTNVGTTLTSSVHIVPVTATQSPPTTSTNTSSDTSRASSAEHGVLHLTLLDGDSGQPVVSNGKIDRRDWKSSGPGFTRQQLHTTSTGTCDIRFPDAGTTKVELMMQIDGFADTRLHWELDHGETVPTNYVVRLVRPVIVGGRVVDADGQPVAGAKVGINRDNDPTVATQTEDHEFAWFQVSTDADGRWSVNHIAPDMLHRLSISASDPNHVDTGVFSAGRNPELQKQLREGTYTLQMGRAVSLRGIVVDPDGRPISGAKVIVGFRHLSTPREATSAADGTFVVTGCKPGKTIVSAEMKGFAATTMDTDLSPDSEPVRLTLQRGRVVSLRVVNGAGQGVASAHVELDTFFHYQSRAATSKPPPVQTEFHANTDAEGRVVWSNAPNIELIFMVTAPGYMRIDAEKVGPGEQEHVITLPPSLVVTGTVRDVMSGQPIPRFRITCGWPDANDPGNLTMAHWSSTDSYRLAFAAGKFRYTFEAPMVTDATNLGYVLKFEADGYAPYTSRVIRPDEGQAQLDVHLHTATAMIVTVLLPDGRPAVGADVGLVSPTTRLQLVPGGFSHQNLQSPDALLVTDSKGKFSLSSDDTITRVIVACADGYAKVKPSDLASQPVIRLQLWGRVEGTYMSGGKPAAGRELLFTYRGGDFDTVSTDPMGFRVKTDTDGRFVFPQVPPGKHSLSRLISLPPPQETSSSIEQLEGIEIRAGETTTITLASGYMVSARLRWADGMTPETSEKIFAIVQTPYPTELKQLMKDHPAMAKLKQSPAFQEFVRTARAIQAVVTSDGTVTAEGVRAGEYVLNVMVVPAPAAKQVGQRVFPRSRGEISFTVPAEPSTGSLDLGEIVMDKFNDQP